LKYIGILILMILLLGGCANPAAQEAAQTSSIPPSPAAGTVLTKAVTGLESATDGALRAFSLESPGCGGLAALDGAVVIITRGEDAVFLRRLDPETCTLGPALEFQADILAPEAALRSDGQRLSWYDAASGQLVATNGNGEETVLLDCPGDVTGVPMLSPDGERLYYCTARDIRVLERSTGISRVLKEEPAKGKTLAGIHMNGTVLSFRYRDPQLGERICFLCAETGRLLWEGPGEVMLWSGEEEYLALLPEGTESTLVTGTGDTEPRVLLCGGSVAGCWYVPRENSAFILEEGEGTAALCRYRLPEGILDARLELPPGTVLSRLVCAGDGSIWFTLAGEDTTLYRWLPETLTGSERHTLPYYPAGAPDLEGLARCEALAREIGEKYGIRILIWKEAAGLVPREHSPEPEHRVYILQETLSLLDGWLSRYPECILETLAQRNNGLTICLLRSMSGLPEPVQGSHFRSGDTACIALTVGPGCENGLYHELCLLIDTVVLGRSSAYDGWDSLNPGDFSYDYDYTANLRRQSYQFLQDHSRSFVDMFSMSFPREDRARIMSLAMQPDGEALFDAPILQQKLVRVCAGIREAFGLEEDPRSFPWEQYLHTPLSGP